MIEHRSSAVAVYFFVGVFFLTNATAYGASFSASDALGHLQNGDASFVLSSSNNAPSSEGFSAPVGMAVDADDNRLFVADQTNNRVLVFALTSGNLIQSNTASYVLGQPDFVSSAAGITSSTMSAPYSLSYDTSADRLFVLDNGNNRILVFNVATSTIANGQGAVNVLGQADFVSNGVGTSSSTLSFTLASSLAFDTANQRLFVGDGGNSRVLIFNVATSTIANGQAAVNVLGQANFVTGATGTASSSTLASAVGVGVAFDSAAQRLFVGAHRRVLAFNVATSTIANGQGAVNVLGQINFTSTTISSASTSTLGNAASLAVDAAGQRLFVADATTNFGSGNNRILAFDVASITNGEAAVNVLGQADFVSNTTPVNPSATMASALRGIAYESASGQLFVADETFNRILAFNVASISDGEAALGVLGQTNDSGALSFLYGGVNNAPNRTSFSGPLGIAIDAVGRRLFMVDTANSRVEIFNLDANNDFQDYEADYVLGQPDFRTGAAGTTSSTLSTPEAVAYDPTGKRLFVSDTGNDRILVFNVATSTIANGQGAVNVLGQVNFEAHVEGGDIDGPEGLAYDAANNRLFVTNASGSNVFVFNVATSTITNGQAATAEFGTPSAITVFDPEQGGNVTTVNVTSSTLRMPAGLAYDPVGERLFLGDKDDNRVLVYNVPAAADLNGISSSIVLGQTSFTSGDAGAVSSSTLSAPWGVAYDTTTNRLFVADKSNHRVLGFEAATSTLASGAAATLVLGQSSFDTANSGTSVSTMNTPYSVFVDDNGRLFVGDYGNNRILRYDPVTILTTTLPDATVSQSYTQAITTANSQGTVTYSLVRGSLPPGMSVGSVAGTPTAAGTYTFTIRASDVVSGVGQIFDDQAFTLTVVAAPVVIIAPGSSGRPMPPSGSDSGPGSSSATSTATSTPPATPPAGTSGFVIGSRGPAVKALQQFLNAQGFLVATTGPGSPGNETEYFGPLTANALARFMASTSSGSNRLTKDLARGMTDPEIRLLQQFLNAQGFLVATTGPGSPGNETEYFGALTLAAVKAYQKANGIIQTGYFGPLTRASVNAALAK